MLHGSYMLLHSRGFWHDGEFRNMAEGASDMAYHRAGRCDAMDADSDEHPVSPHVVNLPKQRSRSEKRDCGASPGDFQLSCSYGGQTSFPFQQCLILLLRSF